MKSTGSENPSGSDDKSENEDSSKEGSEPEKSENIPSLSISNSSSSDLAQSIEKSLLESDCSKSYLETNRRMKTVDLLTLGSFARKESKVSGLDTCLPVQRSDSKIIRK